MSHDTSILNWAEGPFKGGGPEDQDARRWCDAALQLFYPDEV